MILILTSSGVMRSGRVKIRSTAESDFIEEVTISLSDQGQSQLSCAQH